MCGIAAMVGFNGMPASGTIVERMTATLVHRGPDDVGVHMTGSVGLGFRRLAILDLSSAGHQPMMSSDGQCVIIFNGAIFNYIELRSELQSLGHRFRSTGDTEVLLAAYQQWGRDCLFRLNGMWAFLIYDARRKHVFGSRDHFGIKPLYFLRDKSFVLFASEIKAIRASGLYRRAVHWDKAAEFLVDGRLDESNETLFSGIEKIPAGTAFYLALDGQLTRWTHYSLARIPSVEIRDPVEEVATLFEDSVRLRLRSDAPVAVSLSGGIDSTAIICAAARDNARLQPLRAFSYRPEEFDESEFISDTLAVTRSRLTEVYINPRQIWDNIPFLLWHQDEPVHTMTALVGLELSRCIAENHVRVVLNGQGADETMGGYSSYFLDHWTILLRQGRLNRLWHDIRSYTEVHGGDPTQFIMATFARFAAWQCQRIPAYKGLSFWKRQSDKRHRRWFSYDLTRFLRNNGSDSVEDKLDGRLRQSVNTAPLPLYLRIEDRNSMAHSLEMRLPFLDHRLVSLLFSLPDGWKVSGPWNKFVFRQAMRDLIPESVRMRPDKMGFATPVWKWLIYDLYEPMTDLLNSQEARERGLYDSRAILRDFEAFRRNYLAGNESGPGTPISPHVDSEIAHRLFRVAQFEMWDTMLKNEDFAQASSLATK